MSWDSGSLTRLVTLSGVQQRFAQYALVGAVGLLVNESVLFLATGVLGVSYVVGGVLSRVVSIAVNFLVNDSWTWAERGDASVRDLLRRGWKYGLTRVVGVGIGLGSLVVLVEFFDLHYLVANVFAVGVGVFWGFWASERWVWRPDGSPTAIDLRDRVPWLRRLSDLDRSTKYVLVLTVALFAAFSIYTIMLYRRFQLTGADFGSYVHMFWTTVTGNGFLEQGKFRAGHPGGSYWGAHFSLTLLAFLPAFALVPRPETLLVTKSLVVAASIPVLWLLARSQLEHDRVAGLVVVSYALNPFLWSAWSFDFQEQALLPLLVFAATYLYVKRRHAAFLGALLLVLFTNEFTIPIVVGFLLGLLVTAARRDRLEERTPVLLAGIGLAALVQVVAGFTIAQFSTVAGIPRRVVAIPLQGHVPGARTSITELLLVGASNPDLLVSSFATGLQGKAVFLAAFCVPVLFLALVEETSLGALGPFLGFAWVLSSKAAYHQFDAHYPFYLLPFVYVGVVFLLRRASPSLPSLSREWFARLLALVLVANVTAGVVIGAGNMKPVPPESENLRVLEAAIDDIPAEASLVTQNDVYPHVATRPNTAFVVSAYEIRRYERDVGRITPTYILYDTSKQSLWAQVLLDAFGDRLGDEYGLYRYEDGVWVFKRGYEGTPTAVTSDRRVAWVDAERHRVPIDEFALGGSHFAADRIVSAGGTPGEKLWYGPYVMLPSGHYEVTFRVWADGDDPDGDAAALDVAVGPGHRVVANETVTQESGWQTVTLEFELDRPQSKVEFRGTRLSPDAEVVLADVVLESHEEGAVR